MGIADYKPVAIISALTCLWLALLLGGGVALGAVADGIYKFTNWHSGMVLEVQNTLAANASLTDLGAPLDQGPAAGLDHQADG